MRRYLLAIAVAITAGGATQAQVFVRPAPVGFSPYTSRVNFGGAFFPSPTGGYGFTFSRSFYARSSFLVTSAPPVIVYPGLLGGYYTGSSGMNGAAAALGMRQQNVLRQAQQQALIDPAIRQTAFERLATETTFTPEQTLAKLKTAPESIRLAATEPTEAGIVSGNTLNALLDGLKKARPVAGVGGTDTLPPELVTDIHFTGNTAADTIELMRSESLVYPGRVTGAEFDSLRTATDRTFAAVRTEVVAGRRVEVNLLDQLVNHTKRLQAKYAALARGTGTLADEKATAEFLNRLTAVAAYLKRPESERLVVAEWKTAGVTVADLTAHMLKHNLRFAAAKPGAESAYLAAHRSLATYLTTSWTI